LRATLEAVDVAMGTNPDAKDAMAKAMVKITFLIAMMKKLI